MAQPISSAKCLHDGQVQEWTTGDTTFAWRLLIGDLQQGYRYAVITYDDAELIGPGAARLGELRLTEPDVELMSDEIDVAAEGRFEHRFDFWPGLEFGVRFGSVEVDLVPTSGRGRR